MGESMKKLIIVLSLVLYMFIIHTGPVFSENKKLAQTGMKFLQVSLDARSSSMGSAMTALEHGSTAMFYNPAGMARMENLFDFSFGQINYIADFKYIYGSAAINLADGEYGVIGLTFLSVDYGDFISTIRAKGDQGFIETGIFSPSVYSIGIGYSKALTDKFSVGGHIKYVNQDLSGGIIDASVGQNAISRNFEKDVTAFDFGILYKTGFESLNFGMNLRNFSNEVKYIKESFQLPLTFEIGLSINAFDFINFDREKHSLIFSVDAVHPRDNLEQIDFGFEYTFMEMFSLRTGYTSPSGEQGINLGLGLRQKVINLGFAFDYGYTSFGIFDDIHRITIKFSLLND